MMEIITLGALCAAAFIQAVSKSIPAAGILAPMGSAFFSAFDDENTSSPAAAKGQRYRANIL